jgi:hypothetical protein
MVAKKIVEDQNIFYGHKCIMVTVNFTRSTTNVRQAAGGVVHYLNWMLFLLFRSHVEGALYASPVYIALPIEIESRIGEQALWV